MSLFNKLEFDIMDEVYFVSSFRQVMENTGATANEVSEALRGLLQNEFVQQLIYNTAMQDFEKMEKYDETQLQTASYVATKKGLLAHNSNN